MSRGIPNLSQLRAILQAIGNPPIKRALIVGSNVQYTAGRLAETIEPNGVRVFRDEAVAFEWLFAGRSAPKASGALAL